MIRSPSTYTFSLIAVLVAAITGSIIWMLPKSPDPDDEGASATVSQNETQITVFNVPWGTEEQSLGFIGNSKTPSLHNNAFERFYVTDDDTVFIIDRIKERISLYRNSRLIKVYPYPPYFARDIAIAANEKNAFLLDGLGVMSKLDIQSGQYAPSKTAVQQKEGYLTDAKYTMYMRGNVIVIHDRVDSVEHCYSDYDLSMTNCPFLANKELKDRVVYVDGTFSATDPKFNDNALLHDKDGRVIGKLHNIGKFSDTQLFPSFPWTQITRRGIYRLRHGEKGAELIFSPWSEVGSKG